jgi:hypothetical protein
MAFKSTVKHIYRGIRRFKIKEIPFREDISLAIQRGNAASIRGTFPDSAILSEIFVLNIKQKCYVIMLLIF